MSRCLIHECSSTPSGLSASGLCPVHHEAAIRLRLVVPGARASANALRVILAVELAERCRREHAALPELHERLRQADRRAEEQAAEIGTLRELHLQATARETALLARSIEITEQVALQAAIVREEELARVLLSLEQAKEREAALITRIEEEQLVAAETAREEAAKWIARVEELEARLVSAERLVATERAKAREAALITRIGEREDELRARIEELETQIVSAERRVKGAEAEAATLRKLKGGAAPADNFNRRPPDNGRRML